MEPAKRQVLAAGLYPVILFAMKTAISIPDELFADVERYAVSQSLPRSQVFVLAARAYLSAQRNDSVTEQLNQALAYETQAGTEETTQWVSEARRQAASRLGEESW